jgi:hypothetical protein
MAYRIRGSGGNQDTWLGFAMRYNNGEPYEINELVRIWNTLSSVKASAGYGALLHLAAGYDLPAHHPWRAENEFDACTTLDRPADPLLGPLAELNARYAIVQMGSDVLIMQERGGDPPAFLNRAAFELLHRNRRVPLRGGKPGTTESLGKAWLAWGDRRTYNAVVFKPGLHDMPPNEFNLWRGWAIAPSSNGNCDRFLEHLRHVVCLGKADDFEWLLDWTAHIFQRPQEKPGVAVGLQGRQGAGKSIVGQILQKLLGPYHATVDKPEHITGHFNAHLAHNLLLQAEEAFWAGSKSAEGTLKHLVTGPTLRIERKGIDSVEMPSYTRLLISSNNDRVWPTALDDRRLAIFRVSDERAGDHDYFRGLFEELASGGYEHLLHLLLTRSIDHARLQRPPLTEALLEQAAESLSPEEAWLHSLLEDGEIEGTICDDGSALVASASLFESYRASLSSRHHAKTRQAFGVFLRQQIATERTSKQVRVSNSDGRCRSYELRVPPLAECRKRYAGKGRAAQQTFVGPDLWVATDFSTYLLS